MKLYRESLRRLSRVGFATLMITFIATILLQLKLFASSSGYPDSVYTMMPCMRIYVFAAGLLFALVGFSFLNSRADSDFYHSLPIKRIELYLAVSLAALTWIAATIILCSLTSFCLYLFSGTKYVPLYFPVGTLLFIAAAMLVFAAGAIGCALSGTLITNLALSLTVLFLPRLIQFMLARGVVDLTDIVSWLDLEWYLNPATNVVTGIVVMLRRGMLAGELIKLGNILYSLLLAVVELAIGAWLFVRRPSELAEHGAKSGRWQTTFACCMAMPALLYALRYSSEIYYTNRISAFATLVIVSLVCFVTYQFVVLRDGKRVLKSMPWFLCPLGISVALFIGMVALSDGVLGVRPSAQEIRSVSFPDYSYTESWQNYSVHRVAQIEFTDDAVKQCVAETLESAAAHSQKNGPHSGYETLTHLTSVEPVVITLQSGRKVRRSIAFDDINALNELRAETPVFNDAVRAFLPDAQVTYLNSNEVIPLDEVHKLRDCYNKESTELGVISSYQYLPRKLYTESYRLFSADGEQTFGSFTVAGYDGLRRMLDYYEIRANMPRTAKLYMMLINTYGEKDANMAAGRIIKEYDSRDGVDDNYNISCTFFNVPMEDGSKQQVSLSSYMYRSAEKERNDLTVRRDALTRQIAALLPRATITNDPEAMSVNISYQISFTGEDRVYSHDSVFYAFEPEDEAKIMKLINEWITIDYGDMAAYGYIMPAVAEGAPA